MQAHIDRQSPVPLYFQVEQHLRRQIQNGMLRTGDALPNELTLQQLFRVSRTTVRQALSKLAIDGTIVRRKGSGTFVAQLPELEPLSCLMSFTREMLAQGRQPRTDILVFERRDAGPDLRGELELQEGAAIHHLRRLRMVDGSPACLVDSYVPAAVAPSLRRSDFEPTGLRQSLMYVLEHVHGAQPSQGEEWSLCHPCSQEEAQLLSTDKGTPLVRDICVVRNIYNIPILYEKAAWGTAVRRRLARPRGNAVSATQP